MSTSTITFHRVGRDAATPQRARRNLLDLLLLLLVGLAAWFAWPAALGGNTRFIIVQGSSMEPVYHLGDALLVKRIDHPKIGDIVVVQLPKGGPAPGMMVVHRIHAIRPDGTFETKGDNRRYPDPFKIAKRDILGSPRFTLPHFGRLVGLASSPLVVGFSFGLMSMLFLLPAAWKEHRASLEDDQPSEASDAER
jgi:signal peptidase I